MTVSTWPGDVPTSALVEDSSYDEKGEDNLVRQQPLVGPEQTRRRSYVPSQPIVFSTIMTFDEYDIFIDWYVNTLLNGSLLFTRPHPRKTTETITAQFMDYPASGPPISSSQYQVQIQIRSLSKTTLPAQSFDFSLELNSGYIELL